MIYLLIGYMWLFVHRPFEVWPWLAAVHIERGYMLATLAYWAFFVPKTWIPCRSHFGVFLLAVTYCVALIISPYATFHDVENWYKVLVFYLLVVTSVRNEYDFKILVLAFVASTAIYELHSLREYFNGRSVYRMGTTRMIGVDHTTRDPNTFGATINYALPFLIPAWTVARTKWQQCAIIALGLLAVVCILLTGSRSAFVALLFLILIASAASRYRWRILPVLLILPPIIWVGLRSDLQNRYLSVVDSSKGVGAAQESAEGRTKSFWDGMNSFAENPIFGAGLGSYKAKTGFATHNLYNQAMGELGSFGLAVLIGFAWAYQGDLRESRRLFMDTNDRGSLFLYRICIAASLSGLLLFLLGWGSHNLTRYNWLWFGAFSGIALYFLRQHNSLLMSDTELDMCGLEDDIAAYME
jgi:O-antigen ligase